MKNIDFTKPGGFPLTQDRLAYLQDGYTEVLQALTKMGGTGPFVISGMAVSGTTVADGWFYYNGDIVQFTGSTVSPGAGEVMLVLITSSAGTLVFNDGSTPSVVLNKTATLTHGPAVTDATHFPVSALQPFGTGFGQNNRETVWNSITVSTDPADGGVTGTIYYKKDFTANTLQIRAVLISSNAQNFAASPGALYYLMGTLPVGYVPANDTYFIANYYVGGQIKDDIGISWIKTISCSVTTSGQISANWIRPDVAIGGYGILFNTIIPLD